MQNKNEKHGVEMNECKLLPCPFCGSDAEYYCNIYGVKWVFCTECDAQLSDDNSDLEEAQIKIWNTRADKLTPELIRVMELMGEALEHYTKVVVADHDPNSFTPKVKDGGNYARQALSEYRKLKGE